MIIRKRKGGDRLEILNQLLVNGVIIGLTYALFALGLTLIFGILHIINFAHGEFYMLGAFGSFILQQEFGFNYWMSAVGTILVLGVLAFFMERYVLRSLVEQDHLNSLLVTFGISIILLNLVVILYGTTPRQISTPFSGVVEFGNIFITQQKLFVLIAGVILIALVNIFIKKSKWGKLMRAVSQNTLGAKVSGIPIKKVYSFAFIFGICLATIAGILIGPTTFAVPHMGMTVMLKGFVIVILGGLGSIPGAILGGMLLGVGETAAATFLGNSWKDMIGFLILILVLLIRPQGIFGVNRRSQ